jgi:hypothetical protein
LKGYGKISARKPVLRGTARSGAKRSIKEGKVSEDEKREETEVEAHKTRITGHDEKGDEPRAEDENDVEAHKVRVAKTRVA